MTRRHHKADQLRRDIARRGMALLLLAAAVLLGGCAAPGYSMYHWVPDPTAPVCAAVQWVHVSYDERLAACGPMSQACARPKGYPACAVVSHHSADAARRIIVDGEPLWDHEARHVLQRLRHPAPGAATGARP